jgi:Zn-finger nucleic acid-binding protein
VGHAAGVVLHGCGRCGGVWLATACAQRFAKSLPLDAIKLAARASHGARVVPDTAPAAPCPVCTRPMNRVRAAAARVDLDTCAAHGTWYDRDELEHIARVIRTSGWGAAGVGMAAGAGMVAGAGMAMGAGMGGGQAQAQAQAFSGYDVAGVATEVGAEVVAEGVVEVGFSVVGSILGAVFDGAS